MSIRLFKHRDTRRAELDTQENVAQRIELYENYKTQLEKQILSLEKTIRLAKEAEDETTVKTAEAQLEVCKSNLATIQGFLNNSAENRKNYVQTQESRDKSREAKISAATKIATVLTTVGLGVFGLKMSYHHDEESSMQNKKTFEFLRMLNPFGKK